MADKFVFRPHRGSSTIMSTTKKDLILENGELFVEYPDETTNNNQFKIKIGNGVDTYESLKYAIDPASISVTVDNEVTSTGENPVKGKAIYSYIDSMITQAINNSY